LAKGRGGPGQAIADYLKGTRAELRRVNWPDRQEATRLTIIVLAVTFLMAALLGLMDFVFAELFALII
jgi:preprotein translocase subunit SecE